MSVYDYYDDSLSDCGQEIGLCESNDSIDADISETDPDMADDSLGNGSLKLEVEIASLWQSTKITRPTPDCHICDS